MNRHSKPSRKAQAVPFSPVRRLQVGKRRVLRFANHDLEGPVSPQGEESIRSLGSGAPLPAAERAFFEPRLGTDLGAVRVHSGERAAAAAESISARAFTLGSDVVFGQGEFRAGSAEGRRLIAHELAHTVQQGAVQQGAVQQGAIQRDAIQRDTVRQGGSASSEDVAPEQGPRHLASETSTSRIQREPVGVESAGPEDGAGEIDYEKLERENHLLRRAAVVDLLEKGKAEGVGEVRTYAVSAADQAQGLEPIDVAILHQSDVLVAAAEADARLFLEEKEKLKAALRGTRQAVRKSRWQGFVAGLRRQREQRLELKGQRKAMSESLKEAKALRESLNSQDQMRGHRVEWLSTLIATSNGFGFTQPLPGHPKIVEDRETGAYQQPSMREPSDQERKLVGLSGEAKGDIHSHPYTGDPRQDPDAISATGLGPSDDDRETARENPSYRQTVLNPRGRVIGIGTGGAGDRELRAGLGSGEASAAKEPAAMAEVKRRLGVPSFEALVQQQLRVLRAVDRQRLVEMQRLKSS